MFIPCVLWSHLASDLEPPNTQRDTEQTDSTDSIDSIDSPDSIDSKDSTDPIDSIDSPDSLLSWDYAQSGLQYPEHSSIRTIIE